MSGGSMDYLYRKIEYEAHKIKETDIRNLAWDFATLMRDLEWYQSDDTCEEDWQAGLRRFRAKWLSKDADGVAEAIGQRIKEMKAELEEFRIQYAP